jgi:hypothetical protein
MSLSMSSGIRSVPSARGEPSQDIGAIGLRIDRHLTAVPVQIAVQARGGNVIAGIRAAIASSE